MLMWNVKDDQDPVNDKTMQFRIEQHGDAYSIYSLNKNQYIYAGGKTLNDKRRHVLSWAGDANDSPANDPLMLFNVEKWV